MLNENGELFLDNSIDGCNENTDYTLGYKSLNKNIDRYGVRLLYLEVAYVFQLMKQILTMKKLSLKC